MKDRPIIYSLFPRIAGTMPQWLAHAARAKGMGFNWVLLNPIQYAGFSGSLYAIKDFYRLNPLFVPEGCAEPLVELRHTIRAMHEQGLKVMMDLVVNHTSKDSPLIKDHPTWFRRDENGYVVSPSAIDPADSRKVTVWGDLAEVDNANSPNRQELWAYWTAMVQYYLDLGFDGFRCDAAYKVPARLWQLLISAARKRKGDALFVAETLGCRLAEVRGLAIAGFDYLFNSSKWWNFDATWAIDQHTEFAQIGPSVSFAETHDTSRLMEDTGGLLQVQKQRYVLSAAFASGLLMPIGFEYGFRKKLDVVSTMPNDWEQTDADISTFIASINTLRQQLPILNEEGRWEVLTDLSQPTTLLKKSAPGVGPLLMVVNKDWHADQNHCLPELSPHFPGETPSVYRLFGEAVQQHPVGDKALLLGPAEIAFITVGEAPAPAHKRGATRR